MEPHGDVGGQRVLVDIRVAEVIRRLGRDERTSAEDGRSGDRGAATYARRMDPEDFRAVHLFGKHVCDGHIEDEWLASWVRGNGKSTTCDYCKRRGADPFAADVGELAEIVLAGLETAYGNADDEGVPWEGGYVLVQPMLSVELIDDEAPSTLPSSSTT